MLNGCVVRFDLSRTSRRNILGAHPGSSDDSVSLDKMATAAPSRKRTRLKESMKEPTNSQPNGLLLSEVLTEIRSLREEQRQQQLREKVLETLFCQREEAQQQMEQRLNELNRSYNSKFVGENRVFATRNVTHEIEYKIKPNLFDGSVPLCEFLTQFEIISRANNWTDSAKSVVLAVCLWGKAHSVLECFGSGEQF